MRVRPSLLTRFILAAACFATSSVWAQVSEHTPSLLLNPKLLRRLKRDCERQTVRWVNFAKRVQTVADSPERGFELALYYAVTQDRERGREATAWALAHQGQRRQVALVLDWAAGVMSAEEQRDLHAALKTSASHADDPASLRDALFAAVLDDKAETNQFETSNGKFVANLKRSALSDPAALYAACEYLQVYRAFTHADVRELDPPFFNLLPREVLLSLEPKQVERPPQMVHVAALALVTLDPNLESSQYLQGWAMEDSQMLQEGEGVAYEFLWADPYLPGIAYQNMDPWTYDDAGTLYARMSWTPDACWLHIASGSEQSKNCESNPAGRALRFGTLTLLPMNASCVMIPSRNMRETAMLWRLKPGARLTYESNKQKFVQAADRAGLWPVPNEVNGKVCSSGADSSR